MRRVLIIIFVLISTSAFAQNIDQKLLVQTPNCENVAFNSARLIEHYFEKKNYDSISVVFNRWEDFCGTTEPLFRLKVLHQIQIGKYSEDWMEKDYLMNFIFLYLDRLDYSKMPNAKLIYEQYKIPFGYISLNSPFDDLIVVWANSLLERNNLLPAERAFCLLYTNQPDAFWQMLKDKKLSGTKLQEVYAEQVRKTEKSIEGNFGFMTGIFLPTENLAKVIGSKAMYGIQGGMKINKIQYDLTILMKSGKASQDYEVFYENAVTSTNYFLGGYVGADISYQVLNNFKRELDILGGIGGDFADVIKSDTEKKIKGKELGSFNFNVGLGYRFYSKRMNYLGIQAKYNIVNFNNKQGTDLGGNYMSLILTYNLFGNIQKDSMMKRLKIKQ
jgi:hypothetical protein